MKKGIIAGIVSGMCWGTMFIVPVVLHDFSPVVITAVRYTIYGLISAVIMIPFLPSIRRKLDRRSAAVLFRLVLTGNVGTYLFTVIAVQYVGVAPASLVIGLSPAVILIFGKSGLPLQKLILPMGLIIGGILCLNVGIFDISSAVSLRKGLVGLAAAVISLALWCWYTIDNARYLQKHNRFTTGEWSLLFGAFTLPVALLMLGGAALFSSGSLFPETMTPERLRLFLLATAGAAIIPSLIGNASWNIASRLLPVSLTGQFMVLETIFALLYSFLYTGIPPVPAEILAILLLLTGVSLMVNRFRPAMQGSH